LSASPPDPADGRSPDGPGRSVRQIGGRMDGAGPKPDHELSFDPITLAVLLGAFGSHVTPADAGRPPPDLDEITDDLDRPFDRDEAEWRSLVVNAQCGATVPDQVPTFHRS